MLGAHWFAVEGGAPGGGSCRPGLGENRTDTFFFWFAPKQVVDCAPTHLFPVRVSSHAYLKNWLSTRGGGSGRRV